MPDHPEFDEAALIQRRVCRRCEAIYTIAESWEHNRQMFGKPHDYQTGCLEYCLGCWLGVGPLDFPESYGEESAIVADDSHLSFAGFTALPRESTPVENDDEGDLVARFQPFLNEGYLLAVMPISRVFLDLSPISYRNCYTFLSPGVANLEQLNIVPNREMNCPLAEGQSAASGVTEETLSELTLVAFPCRGDWTAFRKTNHNGHLDLIRQLSEGVDRACLDFVRYKLCGFDPVDTLPGRAGQVASNPMMAGLCLFNPAIQESRIVGGAAFTHSLTRGLGLALETIDAEEFPRDGEVGHIVEHALALYAAAIEAATATSGFVQALSILEILAYPDEFRIFQEVKKVIARYVAKNRTEYDRLLERFLELTGKKDSSGKTIGFRTRVVHMGERLEEIIPRHEQRTELFRELDRYIRMVIEHMMRHSEMTWEEYQAKRETMRPFDR